MKPSLQERLEQQGAQHGIDLTPMIDVVFILLIFFIVTTVFIRETGVEVERPQAVTAQQLQGDLILLAVTADGAVVHDSASIGVAGVRSTVAALLQAQVRPVVIQADAAVNAALLVRVIDEARLAGAESVNIATREPQ